MPGAKYQNNGETETMARRRRKTTRIRTIRKEENIKISLDVREFWREMKEFEN